MNKKQLEKILISKDILNYLSNNILTEKNKVNIMASQKVSCSYQNRLTKEIIKINGILTPKIDDSQLIIYLGDYICDFKTEIDYPLIYDLINKIKDQEELKALVVYNRYLGGQYCFQGYIEVEEMIKLKQQGKNITFLPEGNSILNNGFHFS